MNAHAILSHKSVGLKKPTRGTQPGPDGNVRVDHVLGDRNQQWKHICKSAIAYFDGLANIEQASGRATLALCDSIQVPFHEGGQFLGEGGWQSALYAIRDHTKTLATLRFELADQIQSTVVGELEHIRSKIKSQIGQINEEASKVGDALDKEREKSTRLLTQLQAGIDTFENSSERMLPQYDPYVSHIEVQTQLTKQLHKENEFQQAVIRFQQEQEPFEVAISSAIQAAAKLYEEAHALQLKKIEAVWVEIAKEWQAVPPDVEYNYFVAVHPQLDPDTPLRSVDAIAFPGQNHLSTVPIREGPLERKKRFTKKYDEGYFVLTPSGYLHERRTADEKDAVPTMSLFLPECSLGPPADPSDRSHKFYVEGNRAHRSDSEKQFKNQLRIGSREHAYVFRARTHADMLGWWEEMDKLSRDTKHAAKPPSTKEVTPIENAVTNVGIPGAVPVEPTAVNDDEEEELEDDSDAESESDVEDEAEETHEYIAPAEAEAGTSAPPEYKGDGVAVPEKKAPISESA